MSEYITRNATVKDIPFLADVIISAEKGVTDKLNYSTLFNLPEHKVRECIIAMFEEEIDGCEFSISSYLVTEFNGEAVAAFSAWIECFDGALPSKILKSNLINYTFPKESIEFLKTKSDLVQDIYISREPMTLQYEYLFISPEHRGKKLADTLIDKLEEKALKKCPSLEKAQGQLFSNHGLIIKLFEKHGFQVVKRYKSGNKETINYIPFDEKLLIEKYYKK